MGVRINTNFRLIRMIWSVTCFAVVDMQLRRWYVQAKSSAESNRANLENVCTFSPSIGGFLIIVGLRQPGLLELRFRIPLGQRLSVSCECCVLMSVRADHSSGGVLPSVACVSVFSKCRQWGGPGQLGLSSHKINWWLLTIDFQNYFVMYKKRQTTTTFILVVM